ncbi:6-phosphogluconate dehydrogenase [Stachybotrys elegans]|uniref:6-phosphogluconate dehydrogenase n=1 Tax=Stachybotrys elegans TaxID=80388 RepID=A0A8K0SSD6_9HYPO|nr:6-phosphogluconate dehydrogenase [Stachybotrys elegans]
MATDTTKARVLVVGAGGVGIMAAYALETGGRAHVTAVLRSNYDAVRERGIDIDSVEHGRGIKAWRPSAIVRSVPDVARDGLTAFDFIVVTTKNIPDAPPSVVDVIRPAVTPGHTVIVLSQNGINIERPLAAAFPGNAILSSVSMISATETRPGVVLHTYSDSQQIGPFPRPGSSSSIAQEALEDAARRYVAVYNPSGALDVRYDGDVQRARWRKLLYNASFNSVTALLRTDTTRVRMSRHVVDDLVLPIMREVAAAAAACGCALAPEAVERALLVDPTDVFFKPSMCQDVERGNLLELENIVGEPLREGTARGVDMPTLRTVYGLLKGLQLQAKEARGLWEPRFEPDNPYK